MESKVMLSLLVPKRYQLLVLLIALSVTVCLPSSWAVNTTIAVPDRTREYQTLAQENVRAPHGIAWIDNDRVIFTSVLYNKETGEQDKFATTFVWNIKTNELSTYMKGSVSCYSSDGWMQFDASPLADFVHRHFSMLEGRYGEVLTPYQWDGLSKHGESRIFINPFSCRRYTGEKERQIPGRIAISLREDHGYLDIKGIDEPSRKKYDSLTFVKAGSLERISEPISIEDTAQIRYYSFAQAYLLHRSGLSKTYRLDESKKPILKILHVNGEVVSMEMPDEIWRIGEYHSVSSYYTKAGVLWVVIGSVHNEAFLEKQGRVEKVIEGQIDGLIAVSPDGCRIAYPWTDGKPSSFFRAPPALRYKPLKITDLCGDKNK